MKIFFDVETTGLLPHTHEVISLCMKSGDSILSLRIKASKPTDPEAMAINGLDPAVGMSKDEASTELINYLIDLGPGRHTLVGENIQFDAEFLKTILPVLLYNKFISYKMVDLHAIGYFLMEAGFLPIERVTFKTMADYFNLGDVPHTAIGDVALSEALYNELRELLNG